MPNTKRKIPAPIVIILAIVVTATILVKIPVIINELSINNSVSI